MQSPSILSQIQQNWGAVVASAPSVGEELPQANAPVAVPVLPPVVAAVHHRAAAGSCEWVGLHLAGRETADLERDVQRLKAIIRDYPIRPHLNEVGGSGFTYPTTKAWMVEHWDVVKEFSALWFTLAGDVVIAEWGHRMETHPAPAACPSPGLGGSFPGSPLQGSSQA